jgi:hypothetical protein
MLIYRSLGLLWSMRSARTIARYLGAVVVQLVSDHSTSDFRVTSRSQLSRTSPDIFSASY